MDLAILITVLVLHVGKYTSLIMLFWQHMKKKKNIINVLNLILYCKLMHRYGKSYLYKQNGGISVNHASEWHLAAWTELDTEINIYH